MVKDNQSQLGPWPFSTYRTLNRYQNDYYLNCKWRERGNSYNLVYSSTCLDKLEGNSLAKEEEDELDNGLSNIPDNLTVNTPSKFR